MTILSILPLNSNSQRKKTQYIFSFFQLFLIMQTKCSFSKHMNICYFQKRFKLNKIQNTVRQSLERSIIILYTVFGLHCDKYFFWVCSSRLNSFTCVPAHKCTFKKTNMITRQLWEPCLCQAHNIYRDRHILCEAFLFKLQLCLWPHPPGEHK